MRLNRIVLIDAFPGLSHASRFASMDPSSAKRRRLSVESAAQLQKTLSSGKNSEESVLENWNILHPEERLTKKAFQTQRDKWLLPARNCFRPHAAPAECDDEEGAEAHVWIADIALLLSFIGKNMGSLASLLHEALQSHHILTPILYCDEAQAANLLSLEKQMKSTLTYLSWLELGPMLYKEDAWLCVSLCQHGLRNRVKDGFATVFNQMVRVLVADTWSVGFPVELSGNACWFKQKSEAIFLGDMDAIRICFSLKGSAGIKPCFWCTNCVGKDSGLPSADWPDISVAEMNKFKQSSDSAWFQAADSLATLVASGATKKEVANYEKALGLVYMPLSILFQPETRQKLPPGNVCVDAMHTMLHNACAGWELALFFRAIQKETDVTLDHLLDSSLKAKWTGPGISMHGYMSYMKGLWSSKAWSETLYKGQSQQVESIIPLMRYFAVEAFSSCTALTNEYNSFMLLADIVTELRKLHYLPCVSSRADVSDLDRVMELHQRAFTLAYSKDQVKPKHHHRRHISAAFLKFRLGLRCEQHESKHRSYKGGIAERHKSQINEEFAFALLPRMLMHQSDRLDKIPLLTARLLEPKPASQRLKSMLGDPTLEMGKALARFHSTTHVKDVVLFGTGDAGVVQHCVAGQQGLAFVLQKLIHSGTKPWGTIWTLGNEQCAVRITADLCFTVPPWWRRHGQQFFCLR